MKKIKLSGRESSVLRAMGFTSSQSAQEILDTTRLSDEDLTDILNGLMDVGYVESVPYVEKFSVKDLRNFEFEVNTGYVFEIKSAIGIRNR